MSPEPARLLLVDDDAHFRAVLGRSLTRRGFLVDTAAAPETALSLCTERPPAHVILDMNLAGRSGLTLIRPLLDLAPRARILVLTGYASIPTVVSAIKLGAAQYLAKPADVADILRALADDGDGAAPAEPAPTQRPSVHHVEWEYIRRTLAEHGGNISATARALGMHRRTLQRKLGKRRPPPPPAG
ncbi:response regulator transcription factor [Thiohalocapsa sp. ML1]|uniref:response regulator transcription factor n=1 Tax=Thiohalocapsa sp. ML1 TaxID=1431688 RepID=UPI000732096D|nr:response regulator [Thiohalocapsa sp. ML1]